MADKKPGMTLIVKTITRLTVGLILIYAIYMVFQGHTGPGGGFAGGVIAALSFVHLLLAYGRNAMLDKISSKKGILLMSAGAVMFLFASAIRLFGKFNLCSSKDPYRLFSSGMIPLSEIMLAFMVAIGLFTVFSALVVFIVEREKK